MWLHGEHAESKRQAGPALHCVTLHGKHPVPVKKRQAGPTLPYGV